MSFMSCTKVVDLIRVFKKLKGLSGEILSAGRLKCKG